MSRPSSKFFFKVKRPTDSLVDFKRILPAHFGVVEEGSTLFLVVKGAASPLGLQTATVKVQRECDRINFLTGVDHSPVFTRELKANGMITVRRHTTGTAYLVKPLPSTVGRQNWRGTLGVQLRLWFLAKAESTPLLSRINLLFQIIECAFPDTNDGLAYPEYKNRKGAPAPRTECKLLRHLASHGRAQAMTSSQLKLYCKRHGLPLKFADPTNETFMRLLDSRIGVLEIEARKIIEQEIR